MPVQLDEGGLYQVVRGMPVTAQCVGEPTEPGRACGEVLRKLGLGSGHGPPPFVGTPLTPGARRKVQATDPILIAARSGGCPGEQPARLGRLPVMRGRQSSSGETR